MREQCQNCGKTIAKYVILDIVELIDDDKIK
jgi:PHP family Zn ribbon phosphoesterase